MMNENEIMDIASYQATRKARNNLEKSYKWFIIKESNTQLPSISKPIFTKGFCEDISKLTICANEFN